MHVKIDYPDAESERAILRLAREEFVSQSVEAIATLSQAQIFQAQQETQALHMSAAVEEYIVQLTMATRTPENYGKDLARWIEFGTSPRGTIALDRCARAHAWLQNKDFVSPDDVRAVLHDVFRHRIILSFEAEAEGLISDQVINELIHRVPLA